MSASNAGWRWMIAGFTIRQMKELTEPEEQSEALEISSEDVIVLDGYDDEAPLVTNVP